MMTRIRLRHGMAALLLTLPLVPGVALAQLRSSAGAV